MWIETIQKISRNATGDYAFRTPAFFYEMPSCCNSERLGHLRQIAQAEHALFPPLVLTIRWKFVNHCVTPAVFEEFVAANTQRPGEFFDFLIFWHAVLRSLPAAYLLLKLRCRFMCLNGLAMEVVSLVAASTTVVVAIPTYPVGLHA